MNFASIRHNLSALSFKRETTKLTASTSSGSISTDEVDTPRSSDYCLAPSDADACDAASCCDSFTTVFDSVEEGHALSTGWAAWEHVVPNPDAVRNVKK